MTYKQLATFINDMMSKEQQDQDVTFYVSAFDEYFGVLSDPMEADENNDVLDSGHIFLEG